MRFGESLPPLRLFAAVPIHTGREWVWLEWITLTYTTVLGIPHVILKLDPLK